MSQSKNSVHPVTMRDVAKQAGVSLSTVSRVLSQKTTGIPITEETRQKIFDAVAALGYHPNMTARSLRTQRTYMIAIMIADISNPFYHFIVRAVQDVAHHYQYDVLIANTDHLVENEQHFCEAMMRRPVDGIIVVPYHLSSEIIGNLAERTGAQVVVLGEHIDHPAVDVVYSDDEQATVDAIQWLIRHKHHQRIGFIGVPDTHPGERRLKGYLNASKAADLAVEAAYLQNGDWTVESGMEAMRKLLALPDRPTAVFACNDHMAIGALTVSLDMNLRIPDEIAIVGFDNIPATSLIRPKLTTIEQFPTEIGQKLATALFDRIEGIYTGPRRIFEGTLALIEREST